MSLQHDIERAMETGGFFMNGVRFTSVKNVLWTEPDTSTCRRIFARKAGVFWGAWLDDPRCDVGNIAMFASARPRRCVSLFDDPSCEVAS